MSSEDTKFKKGWKGGPGRPKGSKDKTWFSLKYWFDIVESSLDEMDPKERAAVGMRGLEMLISKMKQIPAEPQESVANADESLKLLEQLENANPNA